MNRSAWTGAQTRESAFTSRLSPSTIRCPSSSATTDPIRRRDPVEIRAIQFPNRQRAAVHHTRLSIICTVSPGTLMTRLGPNPGRSGKCSTIISPRRGALKTCAVRFTRILSPSTLALRTHRRSCKPANTWEPSRASTRRGQNSVHFLERVASLFR